MDEQKYAHHISDEELEKNLNLSPEQILTWLTQINLLFWETADEKTKEINQLLREGKL